VTTYNGYSDQAKQKQSKNGQQANVVMTVAWLRVRYMGWLPELLGG
jgi:hypothetical protein